MSDELTDKFIEYKLDFGEWCEDCHQYTGVCPDMGCDNCETCGTVPEEDE